MQDDNQQDKFVLHSDIRHEQIVYAPVASKTGAPVLFYTITWLQEPDPAIIHIYRPIALPYPVWHDHCIYCFYLKIL
jgi:hypothetical protein